MAEHRSSTGPVAGIDAAVVGAHHVAIRDGDRLVRFKVMPTLSGMAELTERLRPYAPMTVTVEPTAGTWLSLGAAVRSAGCGFQLVESRATARLREALAGKNKTDRIDSVMLADAGRLFDLPDVAAPTAELIAIRRAALRRHRATIDAHRAECRLWALAAWAFPDAWRACQGHTLAQPVLDRWPHLRSLAHARVESITEIVAEHSKSPNPARRAAKIVRPPAGGNCSGSGGSTWTRSLGRSARCSTTSASPTGTSRPPPAKPSGYTPNTTGPPICSPRSLGSVRSSPPSPVSVHGSRPVPRRKTSPPSFVGFDPSRWESD